MYAGFISVLIDGTEKKFRSTTHNRFIMNAYTIPEDLLLALLGYLEGKPYKEVHQAIYAIMSLKKIDHFPCEGDSGNVPDTQ